MAPGIPPSSLCVSLTFTTRVLNLSAELEGLLLTNSSIADAAIIPVPDELAGELQMIMLVVLWLHRKSRGICTLLSSPRAR